MKKIYEPLTDTIKDTSRDITNTMTETSMKNKKANSDLNEKVLELMNDKGMIPPYFVSSIFNFLFI